MTRYAFAALLPLVFALPLGAQSSETEAAYQRAATLVRDGQGAEGRRIVDSLFVRAREGTPEHSEALYWRAALATDAAQAERDYRQLIVNYPLAPRAGRALLAMAQLELTRGDRERALTHLRRIDREHPGSDARATASFWTARIRFDMQDEPRACHALDEAQRTVAAEEVELKNQIDFFASRCVGVARDTTTVGSRASGVASAAQTTAGSRGTGVGSTAQTGSTGSARSGAPSSRPPTPDGARSGTPSSRPSAAAPTTRSAPDTRRTAPFAIQLAAYTSKADAEALVKRLKGRDISARVVGSTKPYRVWTGSYATRAEANEALKALKARSIDGFIVQQPASR